MEKEHIRWYIKTRSLLGCSVKELITAYGNDYIAYSAIAKWHHRFQEQRENGPVRLLESIPKCSQYWQRCVVDFGNADTHVLF